MLGNFLLVVNASGDQMASAAFLLDRDEYDSDLKWVQALCRNWGRWCTWGKPPWPHDPGVCGSAEAQYVIPTWVGEEPRPAEPDMLKGEQVEAVVSAMHADSPKHSRILRLHYATLPDAAARVIIESRGIEFSREQANWMRAIRARIVPSKYDDYMAEAHGMVLSALTERRRTA